MEQKNEEILVSIITLAYNHESYIRECLDGILMQKTSFKFELLIHDDASTDNTANIIREYEAKHSDIIKPIYQTENQYSKRVPIGSTYLYPRAKGKYIALCEGDDYWTDPYKLQKQVDILENNPEIGLVYSQVEAFDNNGDIGPYAGEVLDAKSLLYANGIVTLTTCFRKKMHLEYINDVKPERKNWLMGDYPMWIWFLYNSKAYFFKEVMGKYRILPNSASHSTNIDRVIAFEESVLDVRLFFINKYWKNERKLLKDVYTSITWYIIKLYIVNKRYKQAFDLFIYRFNKLKFRRKIQGLIMFSFPFVRNFIREKWAENIIQF